jgi:hypothetical protein
MQLFLQVVLLLSLMQGMTHDNTEEWVTGINIIC